jgi:hypothetical protein
MREISWKGKTINQITSAVQKNQLPAGVIAKDNIFRAMPLKIHRREIGTSKVCPSSRVSHSIDEINRPGGYIITSAAPDVRNGLVNIIESPAPSNKTDTYGCGAKAATSYTCTEQNARKRCRSSGIIKRVYDPARSELAYFTNTNQYLVSRSKTFAQNQYQHVRLGDVSIVTNPLVSKDVYSPNGISHCPKASIPTELKFHYYWIDASFSGVHTRHDVVIPPGNYDVHEFNAVFETVMIQNKHYFSYTPTHEKVFLMKIIYNNSNGQVEIQSFPSNIVSGLMYSLPLSPGWSMPSQSTVPVFYFPATPIQTIVGFSTGYYPDIISDNTANHRTTSIGFLSNLKHAIYPAYSITHYKPSNNRFATQGGVSSSDMTVRIKYEAITKNALNASAVFGSHVGNAMSYGVSEHLYTTKDKIGYPVKKTPVIDKYTGELKCESNGRRECI